MGFDIKALGLKYDPPINYLSALGQAPSSVKPGYFYPPQEVLQGLNETIHVRPLPLAGSFSTTGLSYIYNVPLLSSTLCSSGPAHSIGKKNTKKQNVVTGIFSDYLFKSQQNRNQYQKDN